MAFVRRFAIGLAAAALAVLAVPAIALAGSQPAIESESVANVTPTGATLQATIDTAGLRYGAYYQFQLVRNTDEYLSELVCYGWGNRQPAGSRGCVDPPQTPSGVIPLGWVRGEAPGQAVSLDLASVGIALQPGTTYHYRVLAAGRVLTEDTTEWEEPTVLGADEAFTTPPSEAPVIESVAVSHLTPTDATLEATIDTEGQATLYEFELWSSPCSSKGAGCELIREIHLPTGTLLGSFEPQSVSLDLNSAGVTLGRGEYGFSLSAVSREGSAQAQWQEFEAPLEEALTPLDPGGSNGATSPSSTSTPSPNGAGQAGASGGSRSSSSQGSSTAAQSAGSGGPPHSAAAPETISGHDRRGHDRHGRRRSKTAAKKHHHGARAKAHKG